MEVMGARAPRRASGWDTRGPTSQARLPPHFHLTTSQATSTFTCGQNCAAEALDTGWKQLACAGRLISGTTRTCSQMRAVNLLGCEL